MDPLQRLLDEARRDQAVEARAHEHWLGRAAREGATFAGALVDLAESGQAVSVRIASGHVHHGRVVAVGTDFCAVETDGGVTIYINLAALGEVRLDSGAPPAGNRGPSVDMTLAEAVARRSVDARGERYLHDVRVDVEADGDRVRVTVSGRVDYLFARAIPGGPRHSDVRATATATAERD